MMLFIFFDAFYITNYEETLTLYGILKDFLFPAIILLITILGSVWLSKNEFRQLIKNNNKQEDFKNKTREDIIKLANQNIIKEIDNIILIIKENKQNLTFENFNNFSDTKFNKMLFNVISEIGFEKSFDLAIIKKAIVNDLFINYWNSISETPGYLSTIEDYDIYIGNEYNRLNDQLNDTIRKINLQVSDYIHDVVPPFTNIILDSIQQKEPKFSLAAQCIKITDRFKQMDNSIPMIEKTQVFLEDLRALSRDPDASKAMDNNFLHEILYGLSLIANFKLLLKTGIKTYDNYLEALNKVKIRIDNFNQEFSK